MATWVWTSITADKTTDGGDLSGSWNSSQLNKGTTPADFDPAGVNSVRFEFDIQGGTPNAFNDDTWTTLRRAMLYHVGGTTELASFDNPDGSGLGNITSANDITDNSPNTSATTTAWEDCQLMPSAAGGAWATYQAEKMNDGATLRILGSTITITIDYTPAATPEHVSVSGTSGQAKSNGVAASVTTELNGRADATPSAAKAVAQNGYVQIGEDFDLVLRASKGVGDDVSVSTTTAAGGASIDAVGGQAKGVGAALAVDAESHASVTVTGRAAKAVGAAATVTTTTVVNASVSAASGASKGSGQNASISTTANASVPATAAQAKASAVNGAVTTTTVIHVSVTGTAGQAKASGQPATISTVTSISAIVAGTSGQAKGSGQAAAIATTANVEVAASGGAAKATSSNPELVVEGANITLATAGASKAQGGAPTVEADTIIDVSVAATARAAKAVAGASSVLGATSVTIELDGGLNLLEEDTANLVNSVGLWTVAHNGSFSIVADADGYGGNIGRFAVALDDPAYIRWPVQPGTPGLGYVPVTTSESRRIGMWMRGPVGRSVSIVPHVYDNTGVRIGQELAGTESMTGEWIYVSIAWSPITVGTEYMSLELNTAAKGWLAGDDLDIDRVFVYDTAATSLTYFTPVWTPDRGIAKANGSSATVATTTVIHASIGATSGSAKGSGQAATIAAEGAEIVNATSGQAKATGTPASVLVGTSLAIDAASGQAKASGTAATVATQSAVNVTVNATSRAAKAVADGAGVYGVGPSVVAVSAAAKAVGGFVNQDSPTPSVAIEAPSNTAKALTHQNTDESFAINTSSAMSKAKGAGGVQVSTVDGESATINATSGAAKANGQAADVATTSQIDASIGATSGASKAVGMGVFVLTTSANSVTVLPAPSAAKAIASTVGVDAQTPNAVIYADAGLSKAVGSPVLRWTWTGSDGPGKASASRGRGKAYGRSSRSSATVSRTGSSKATVSSGPGRVRDV